MALHKQPGIHLAEVGETWIRIFSKCVLYVTVPEATIMCQYDKLCAGLKTRIDDNLHELNLLGHSVYHILLGISNRRCKKRF